MKHTQPFLRVIFHIALISVLLKTANHVTVTLNQLRTILFICTLSTSFIDPNLSFLLLQIINHIIIATY